MAKFNSKVYQLGFIIGVLHRDIEILSRIGQVIHNLRRENVPYGSDVYVHSLRECARHRDHGEQQKD